MTHLAKDIPYRNTTIAYNYSKVHIDEMLKEAGAKALRWTETENSMRGVALPLLEFAFAVEWKGVEKSFIVRIQAPLLADRKKQGGRYVQVPNRNASMRLLFWYLKARLEAVKFGLEDIFEAFMSRVLNELPNHQIVTMSETVKEHPEVLSEILPSFEIKPKALELKE